MIVIKLAEFLSEWWFPNLPTPAEPIIRRLGYTVRGGIKAGGRMKRPRTAGLG